LAAIGHQMSQAYKKHFQIKYVLYVLLDCFFSAVIIDQSVIKIELIWQQVICYFVNKKIFDHLWKEKEYSSSSA
jgi:hypothetical protein